MSVAMTTVKPKDGPRKVTPKHRPLNTKEYMVKSSDSLSSIALRYNTTPTELSRLNRLSSAMLYPGQTLFVPEYVDAIGHDKEDSKDSMELITKEPHANSINDRPISPDHQIEELLQKGSLHCASDEISEKYLKIKAKFITDGQGVVSGTVLITPQTCMFNPCVSDHLVIERGRDAYALRFPLKSIAHLAFFNDIAAMVTGDKSGQFWPNQAKDVHTTNAKSTVLNSFTDMSQTADSAICQETGERLPSDIESFNSQHADANMTCDVVCTENSIDAITSELTNNDRKPQSLGRNKRRLSSDGKSDLSEHSAIEHNRAINCDKSRDYCKSDSRLCSQDCCGADMDIDNDITHSCPELSKKDDTSCLQIMKDSQSTSTPRKLPEMINQQVRCTQPPSLCTSPVHAGITNVLIDSPRRVRKLTQNKDDLSNLLPDDMKDIWSKETLKSSSVENKLSKSRAKSNDFYKLTPADSDSDDERGQFPDMSRDSGISEGISIHSSANRPRINGEVHERRTVASSTRHVVSPRSNLSDEARLWLGSRGVRLVSDSESSDMSLTETAEGFVEELLPRPAARYEDPPVYLCLKIHRGFWCPTRERSSSIMGVPPNRDQKRREHWFALPKERVSQVYSFLLSWNPNIVMKEDIDDVSRKEELFSASCDDNEGLNIVEDTFSCSPATILGFEKLGHQDADRISTSSNKTLKSVTDDDLPEMLDDSNLLTKRQISMLSRELPSRTVGHSWTLVYSTAVHGISLRTLYRNMFDVESPVLLTVVDENNKVFGTFMSDAPKISDGFYGTGESMLFTFIDESHLKIYHWSGENNFFIKGDAKSLCIGGGDGLFGLWLDEDLYHGRSHSCKTFNNETLSFKEDFICSSLEAWAFV